MMETTMQEVIDQYVKSLELGQKSVHTIAGYRHSVEKKFQAYFKLQNVSDLNQLTSGNFVDFYTWTGLQENSLNTLIRNLSAFFTWLVDMGYTTQDHPFFNVKFGKSKLTKVPRKTRTVFSKNEQEQIIAAAETVGVAEGKTNKQLKFMVAMMFHTALRESEIAHIMMEDIDGCTIKIRGKGGDEAYTYLNDRLCSMMQDYVNNERKTNSEYLFYGTHGEKSSDGSLSGQTINSRFKACVAKAGITKKATAHTTRRSAITLTAITDGKFAAQMLARHKDDKVTDMYIFAEDEVVKRLLLKND